jgi:hypothetical protein
MEPIVDVFVLVAVVLVLVVVVSLMATGSCSMDCYYTQADGLYDGSNRL